MKLPGGFDLGAVFRFVDKLPQPYVESYSELDLRLARKIGKIIELNIVAQNLLSKRHLEFIPSSPAAREIERGIYGKIICRF
jgi:iron complex outermembrane receptor protein